MIGIRKQSGTPTWMMAVICCISAAVLMGASSCCKDIDDLPWTGEQWRDIQTAQAIVDIVYTECPYVAPTMVCRHRAQKAYRALDAANAYIITIREHKKRNGVRYGHRFTGVEIDSVIYCTDGFDYLWPEKADPDGRNPTLEEMQVYFADRYYLHSKIHVEFSNAENDRSLNEIDFTQIPMDEFNRVTDSIESER